MLGKNSIEDIKKYSGVNIGKLKIYENGILNQYNNVDGNEYYDNSSNNFHIVPKAPNDYIKKIENIRHLIFDKMIEKCEENKITLLTNKGLMNRKNIRESLKIEKWIEAEKDDYRSLLCFERLYIDNGDVSCVLGKFQFFKHPTEDNFINKIDGKKILCYPNSGDDGAGKTIEITISEIQINYYHSNRSDNQCKFSETCNVKIHTIFNPKDLPGVFELEIKSDDTAEVKEEEQKKINAVCEAFINFINGDTP